MPRAECNFRGGKNRVSLVTTNQLLCAIPNKNVTDVLLFPFAEVQILVNADFERVWDWNYCRVRALRFLSVVKFRVLMFAFKELCHQMELNIKWNWWKIFKALCIFQPSRSHHHYIYHHHQGFKLQGHVSISFSTGDVMSLCNFAREALIYKGHYTHIGEWNAPKCLRACAR